MMTGCDGDEGQATGATCPQGSTLTYDSFGKGFMSAYCTSCHASTLTGAARQRAPGDHNFDTLALIKQNPLSHLDAQSAGGPKAVNTIMPPRGSRAPTEAERKQLGEWLACGAP